MDFSKLFYVLLFVFIISICGVLFMMSTNRPLVNPDKLLYSDDSDYYYVQVNVDITRHGQSYFGAMSKEDYTKWAIGETGTVWISSTIKENKGWRINIAKITCIRKYDKTGWLPINFY